MKKIIVILLVLAVGLALGQSYKQDETFVKNMAPQTQWMIQRAGVASTITAFAGMRAAHGVGGVNDTAWSKIYWMPQTNSIHAFISNSQDSSHFRVSLWASNSWNSRFMKIGDLSWTNQTGYRAYQAVMDSVGSWWSVTNDLYPPEFRYFRFLVTAESGGHKNANTDYIEFTVLGRND
jgi:hypothetical protein